MNSKKLKNLDRIKQIAGLDPIGLVLSKLPDATQTHPGKWMATCPAHDDKNPSLSIDDGDDGQALVYCHSGCSQGDVLDALGLRASQLFPSQQSEIAYTYYDEDGYEAYQVVRRPGKDFPMRRADPDNEDDWLWGMDGVERVLYNLPEVLDVKDDEPIFILEGEKSTDAVTAMGFTATTNPNGAGRWKKEYNAALLDRNVIIVPDNDDAGHKHAQTIHKHLKGVASSVRVLYLPDIKDEEDVCHWIDAGGTAEKLLELADSAGGIRSDTTESLITLWEPRQLAYSYRERPQRDYLVDGLFIENTLNVVFGTSGHQKSLLMSDCGLSVAGGVEWLPPKPYSEGAKVAQALKSPDKTVRKAAELQKAHTNIIEAKAVVPARVYWLDFDDGMYLTEERLEALARAKFKGWSDEDLAAIPFEYDSFPKPFMRANNEKRMDMLTEWLIRKEIKMLFIGNLGTTSGGVNLSSPDMLQVMTNWHTVAENAKVCTVLVAHPRKRKGGESEEGVDLATLFGSVFIGASLDLALHIERKDDKLAARSVKDRGAPVDAFGAEFWYKRKPQSRELALAGFYGIPIEILEVAMEEAILRVVAEARGEVAKTHLVVKVQAILKDKGFTTGTGRDTIDAKFARMAASGKLKLEIGPKHNEHIYTIP